MKKGVGLGSVAKTIGTNRTNLNKIRSGRIKNIRPEMNNKILGVPAVITERYAYVPSDGVKKLVDCLVDNGYTKKQIADLAGITSGRIVIKENMRLGNYRRIEKACRTLIKEVV